MAAACSIRIHEVAQALRPSLEIERNEPFLRYTPLRYEVQADHTYKIVVETQAGLLYLTVQQKDPGDCVTYVAHYFEAE